MRKRNRLHLRLAPSDHALLRAAAERLDMSLSELVRLAAVRSALDVLREDRPELGKQGTDGGGMPP
jgi:uncharacterized protein (DUF1778 family)